jgi:hypothetical protein
LEKALAVQLDVHDLIDLVRDVLLQLIWGAPAIFFTAWAAFWVTDRLGIPWYVTAVSLLLIGRTLMDEFFKSDFWKGKE